MSEKKPCRFPPFTEAVIICGAFWAIALYVYPRVFAIMADFHGPALSTSGRLLLVTLGQPALMGASLLAGVLVSVGRLSRKRRWLLWVGVVLVLFLSVFVLVGITSTLALLEPGA